LAIGEDELSKKGSRSSGDGAEPKPEDQSEGAAIGSLSRRNAPANAGQGSNGANGDQITYVSLSQETRRRYLNYALSVITSRALPDVRDGLKPVQRRILYVMHHDLGLTATAKTRKSAKVCGDTTGGYHPHGEMAVYDALVRMAQAFSLRYPLVIGQGNFGSIIGLPAAAARYTEVKLAAIAEQLMNELRFETIDKRVNYDATREEPIVLPSRFPNLLVNGTQGIAVGMATNIPPHNLREAVKACVLLIHEPESTVAQLMKFVRGPDFPLGGRIVTDRRSMRQAYEEGRGSIKVRGEWKVEKDRKSEATTKIVLTSVPYGVETGPLLTVIGDIINARKLPQLVGVADESNEKQPLRLVLEMKPGSDPEAIMAYMYRHTALEQNFAFNTTCLVPDEHGALVPGRLSLKELLRQFLDFRLKTVTRRYEFQLRQLERRIHILEGFAIVFKGLDQALKIIRHSSGKQDAAAKLMKAFPLDEEQTEAVLELALYRISSLEIDRILEELKEKRAEAESIRKILGSKARLWKVVETELEEVAEKFGDDRRTAIGSEEEVTEFDPQAYIVRENTNVVLTRDGWLKRVGRLQKVESTRVRDGDTVLAVVPGNTLESVVVFSSDGVAYTLPIDQIPASSGYGDPLSKLVRVGDGARPIWATSTDPRFTAADAVVRKNQPPRPYLLIATRLGQVMQLSVSAFRAPSTKAGRRYCRLREGDRVVFVELAGDADTMFLATRDARVIHFKIGDVPILGGPGKGVRGIKLAPDDEVLGAVQLARPSDCLRVINENDKELSFGQMKYGVTARGGKGIKTSTRTGFKEIIPAPIELVDWDQFEEKASAGKS
jgi:DNA gyrase subunit A